MRYLFILLFPLACVSAKYNAQAQAQVSMQNAAATVIDDARMLELQAPSTTLYQVKKVYGLDWQFIYMYKTGTPPGSRVAENITKRTIIMSKTPAGGYWTRVRSPIDADLVTGMDSVLRSQGFAMFAPINNRIVQDSSALVTERSRAIASEVSKEPTITPGTTLQYWRGDKTWQTFPVIPTNTNQLTNGAGFITTVPVTSVFGRTGSVVAVSGDYTTSLVPEGSNLYWTQTRFNSAFTAKSTTDLSEGTNQYFTAARALAAVAGAGYVKNVQFGGGVATFTTTALLGLNATFNVVVPLNTTFTDNTYSLNSPLVLGSSGVNLLNTTFTITNVVKGVSNVTFTIRNNAALSVAVTGTIDVSALKVIY